MSQAEGLAALAQSICSELPDHTTSATMPDDAEQQLATRLQRRQPEAWAAVYDYHAVDVLTFIVHLLGGDRRSAEDIHQETWLAALSGIDSFDPTLGEFRGWLFGIARRKVALAYRRRSGTTPQDGGVGGCSLLASDSAAILADDVTEAVERQQAVRAALAELGSDSRAVLLGKYVDGRSVDELAGELGRTAKAVESLLSRARGRMRALLRPYFEYDQHVKDTTTRGT